MGECKDVVFLVKREDGLQGSDIQGGIGMISNPGGVLMLDLLGCIREHEARANIVWHGITALLHDFTITHRKT